MILTSRFLRKATFSKEDSQRESGSINYWVLFAPRCFLVDYLVNTFQGKFTKGKREHKLFSYVLPHAAFGWQSCQHFPREVHQRKAGAQNYLVFFAPRYFWLTILSIFSKEISPKESKKHKLLSFIVQATFNWPFH